MRQLSDDEIREDILEVARAMYQKGMVSAYEGNISYKAGDKIYITPSQVCKGYLKKEMLIVTDMSGNIISADDRYKPSSEIKMHIECYRLRRDINAVVHTHAPYATAYALANKPIMSKAYPEMIIIFGKIPLAKYGRPSTDDICTDLKNIVDDGCDVFLIANHGIVSMGCDVYEAFFRNEAAENIAKTLLLAEQIGGEKKLSDDELAALYIMRKEYLEKKNKSTSGKQSK